MDTIPIPAGGDRGVDEVDDVHYCILDYSGEEIDFYFIPMIFLDVFPQPAADLQIGQFRVQLPLDWSIVIADKDFGYMEIIELKDLRDRPYDAFILNPITSFMPDFGEIIHLNNFPDVNWTLPKLKYGHILVVPLENKANPLCILAARDVSRLPDTLDITKIFC
jgi:hypothetical protein